MPQNLTMGRLAERRGAPVYDSVGEKIGKVDEIYYDYETNEPEWIGLGTGFFGTKRVLVPVQGASVEGDGVTVPYSKDQVKDAPDIDSDEISYENERDLYAYYSLGGGKTQSKGRQARGRDADKGVTRHEEELAVGKQEVEAGRARLRKWVETEPVQMDVELRRETARVTREPIDEPVGDADLGEDEVDVPLRGERAVVQKQTVAKERVGIEKDVATDRQTVEDEVRKERVDVEGDADRK
jgi:uncharacterized protein (TIGR02271 family)